jgi:Tol biopolymer transport system component
VRRLGIAFAVAIAALLAGASPARGANDPKLLWKSIETPHFRISFYSTEEDVAEHVATLAEGVYTRLCAAIGWTPTERTEILLTDQTDSANGLTTALPYNSILLNVTAPDDMSALGDVDDWYLELVTHEFTHILHTDHVAGIPALANRVLGKVWAPNQVEPHWMLEGLAVYEESTHTSGGRLRSSMWNMFMRADVLEQNLAPLDVFSNTPRRWPGGNLWYVYGSFFMEWLAETYGEQAIRGMIDDYSSEIIPYGINRSVRRVTGHTFEELYPSWVDSMRRAFDAQAAAVRARGIREGVRVSHTGYTVEHPRWLPANAWPDHAGDLAYFVDDGRSTAGIWALPLDRDPSGAILGGRENRRDLLIRTSGIGGFSFMPDGTAVFSSTDIHENLFSFDDLFELPAHRKSTNGLEGERVRWTDGARALDPSVSPDGRRAAFTTNHRGTTYLMVGDVVPASDRTGAHQLANIRGLLPSEMFDQAYTPRWAPDNRHVAYSVWQRGGYRDIRIVDAKDGSFVEVTHDRAIDGDPVFSADGRWLYYHSDRTGITNVYAYEVATGRLRQVTNVVNGAYQPEPSPDGKWLAYVGYTHDGYDVFVMPIDESRWLDVLPYEETRPAPTPEDPPVPTTPRPYNPLLTLVPRSYSVQITPGNFGQESIVTASGSDIAGLHDLTATMTTEFERPEFEGSFAYVYHRIPFDVGVSVSRSISPAGGFALGSNTIPWIEEVTGATVGINYSMPRAFDGQSFNISYSAARVAGSLPFPSAQLNPYDTPTTPVLGMLGTLHLGWSYSNAEGYLWSVSPERGFSVGATLDVADPALASDFTGYSARFDLETYWPMPWLRHHVLALHAGGGASGGDEAGVGAFYVGGFADVPVIDTVRNYLVQRGWLALRGYPVTFEVGTYYALLNAEYRFPIVNIDRGPSTLPFFLHRISGNVFTDYGSAFNTAEMAEFKTGVGAELWFELTVAYALTFTFRAGYARGLASGGIDKTYFAAVAAF